MVVEDSARLRWQGVDGGHEPADRVQMKLPIPEPCRVFLALGHTDMRKQINGLAILVEDHLEHQVFSGDLFVFCNRSRTIIKILYWYRNGFCLWIKRLEKHRFKWPKSADEVREVNGGTLGRLLDGFDIEGHGRLNFSTIY